MSILALSLNRLYLHPPFYCRSGEIGRHARFRGVCPKGRVGSSPTFGTSFYLIRVTIFFSILASFLLCLYLSS
jgi:hypothetical protein